MFHIFSLIIALTGQPVAILENPVAYQDKTVCQAAIPDLIVKLQKEIDTADDPTIRGQFAVAEAICATEEEMTKAAGPKPGSI
jgi:hypothetical protein